MQTTNELRGLLTSCNKARDVGHVGKQVGIALVCNLPHAGVVVVPALKALYKVL